MHILLPYRFSRYLCFFSVTCSFLCCFLPGLFLYPGRVFRVPGAGYPRIIGYESAFKPYFSVLSAPFWWWFLGCCFGGVFWGVLNPGTRHFPSLTICKRLHSFIFLAFQRFLSLFGNGSGIVFCKRFQFSVKRQNRPQTLAPPMFSGIFSWKLLNLC